MQEKQIKEIAREIKQIIGIDAEEIIEIGLLNPKDAKYWLVLYKYHEMRKSGMTYTDIKLDLSDKYFLSVSTIEKLVYRKPRTRSRSWG